MTSSFEFFIQQWSKELDCTRNVFLSSQAFFFLISPDDLVPKLTRSSKKHPNQIRMNERFAFLPLRVCVALWLRTQQRRQSAVCLQMSEKIVAHVFVCLLCWQQFAYTRVRTFRPSGTFFTNGCPSPVDEEMRWKQRVLCAFIRFLDRSFSYRSPQRAAKREDKFWSSISFFCGRYSILNVLKTHIRLVFRMTTRLVFTQWGKRKASAKVGKPEKLFNPPKYHRLVIIFSSPFVCVGTRIEKWKLHRFFADWPFIRSKEEEKRRPIQDQKPNPIWTKTGQFPEFLAKKTADIFTFESIAKANNVRKSFQLKNFAFLYMKSFPYNLL